MNPVYEDHPEIESWFKVVIFSILALTLVLGVIFAFVDTTGAWVMFGVTLFDGLLFYFIIPRSYQIHTDHIRIVLGGPFGLNIPFKNIKILSRVDGLNAVASTGMRFATSTSYVIEIKRQRGMSVIISPLRGDQFIEQFIRIRQAYGYLT